MTDDCFSLPRRQQLRQVIRQRREACRDLPLALLRLEQLVRDVQRGQNRGLVRLDDRSLRQHLLQGLIHMGRDLARVFGRQIGAHRVLLSADHHLDRVLLRTHWAGLPAAPALVAPPAPTAPGALPAPPALAAPPLPPWRACSSRNVSRDSRSCTRTRAASTRCRSSLFSCSRSETRPLTSGSAFAPAPPRPPPSLSSASALMARARHAANSSATWRRTASRWSSTSASALSPSYTKLVLQGPQAARQ